MAPFVVGVILYQRVFELLNAPQPIIGSSGETLAAIVLLTKIEIGLAPISVCGFEQKSGNISAIGEYCQVNIGLLGSFNPASIGEGLITGGGRQSAILMLIVATFESPPSGGL